MDLGFKRLAHPLHLQKNMKRITRTIITAAVVLLCLVVPLKAMVGGKTMLLFFYQDGCPWCAKMDKILREPEMVNLLRSHAGIVRINVQGRKSIASIGVSGVQAARKFKVFGTPIIIFQSDDGKELLRIPGALNKEDFWDLVCHYIPGIKTEEGCGELLGALPLF